MKKTITIGTRKSLLALWQSNYIKSCLEKEYPDCEVRLDGEVDLAVHSLKDMPTKLPDGLCLTAITERAVVGDAFVSNKYNTFAEMPAGGPIWISGTCGAMWTPACTSWTKASTML